MTHFSGWEIHVEETGEIVPVLEFADDSSYGVSVMIHSVGNETVFISVTSNTKLGLVDNLKKIAVA